MAKPPRPLALYVGEDGKIWASDSILNVAYRMQPAGPRRENYPQPPSSPQDQLPPSDGNFYGVQNGAWSQLVLPPPPISTDAPSDGNLYVRKSGLWVPRPKTTVQIITTPGAFSWSPPAGAVAVRVICIGAGGGGGSGCKAAAGTAAAGGLGGNGGCYAIGDFAVSQLPATVWGFVGFGMIGGVAQTTNSTSGNGATLNPGGNYGTAWGSPSLGSVGAFHSLISAAGGAGAGQGGGNSPFAAPTTTTIVGGDFGGGVTGAQSITANSPTPANFGGKGAGGGGAGGGINTAGTTAYNGGGGSSCGAGVRLDAPAGAAGTVPGGNGGNGVNTNINDGNYLLTPGSGAGGGAANLTGNGGNGGNGALYGGGGGGGGAALNGQGNSGAGGNGANGLVIIIVFF